MDKIELKEIDRENWQFILYETTAKKWIGDFVYSPQSFIIIQHADADKVWQKSQLNNLKQAAENGDLLNRIMRIYMTGLK